MQWWMLKGMRQSTPCLVTGQGTRREGQTAAPTRCHPFPAGVIPTPVSLHLPQMHHAAVIAAILAATQTGPKRFSVLLKGDGRRAVLKLPSL